MNIHYCEITPEIEERIVGQYGDWIRDCNCLPRGKDCFLIAAMSGTDVAGFAAVRPDRWIPPLDQHTDAFIEVLEVADVYHRQGIGSELVRRLEDAVRSSGYRQLRAWSSDDKIEALNLFLKLGYCMCPAAMLGQSCLREFSGQQITGYYYAKLL